MFRLGSTSSAATSANERRAPIADEVVARTFGLDDSDSCDDNTSGEEDAAAPPNLEAEQQLVDELMALDPEQIGLYAGGSKAQPQLSNGLVDVEDLGVCCAAYDGLLWLLVCVPRVGWSFLLMVSGAIVSNGATGAGQSIRAVRRVRRAERATKSCASESESESPAPTGAAAAARPMVSASLRRELEKQVDLINNVCSTPQDYCFEIMYLRQGYRVVGSHSGVKLCRWTKSTLRGRGGCYKHTFYGIESHRCVETTPSMACANKCVFCWYVIDSHCTRCTVFILYCTQKLYCVHTVLSIVLVQLYIVHCTTVLVFSLVLYIGSENT